MLTGLLTPLSKATAPPSSHMAKLAPEKPIPWLANNKFTTEKSTNPMNEKESFPEPSKNCGKKSSNTKASTPLRPLTPKFITNKLKTFSIFSQEFCIVAGIPPMASSSKTWLSSIAATLMIWFLSCLKERKTEEVDPIKWTKTPVEAIQSSLFTSSVKFRPRVRNRQKNTVR